MNVGATEHCLGIPSWGSKPQSHPSSGVQIRGSAPTTPLASTRHGEQDHDAKREECRGIPVTIWEPSARTVASSSLDVGVKSQGRNSRRGDEKVQHVAVLCHNT